MVDEQHPRQAGEHDIPTITLGYDGARTGAALVYTKPVDGGEWTEIGYITTDGAQDPPDVPAGPPNGYDKSPEATRYRTDRIVEWHTPPSNIDLDQIQADIAAAEERRIRYYRARATPLREHASISEYWFWRGTKVQDGHNVIDGEAIDWPPVVADLEARYRHADPIPWSPAGAAEAYERMRAVSQTNWPRVVLTTVISVPDGLADPAVRLYLGLPPLPFDDTLGRWEDDGGR